MDKFDMPVEKRLTGRKGEIRKLKHEGLVPGILYSEDANIPISLEEHKLSYILDKYGNDVFLNLDLDGRIIKAKIKEVQRNPVSKDIKHIDFMPVSGEKLH